MQQRENEWWDKGVGKVSIDADGEGACRLRWIEWVMSQDIALYDAGEDVRARLSDLAIGTVCETAEEAWDHIATFYELDR